jgi:hypothetical protein
MAERSVSLESSKARENELGIAGGYGDYWRLVFMKEQARARRWGTQRK